ncbi:uncharacterized protein LOC123707112 isoform X1 [Pieris brassicae]|uniref:uncharacterized protein LOC123707112 isoform X1 n=1 Tax=Pieris brassicae TaxID=7116 RepID=UPI001E6619E1|nr:uncharacterized protein LOC123707112 isoform X1 [Pieris brassicae]
MKKFLFEYKVLKSCTKKESTEETRERVTVTTSHIDNETDEATAEVGTIRTEQYKRDLAEFQARRSLGADHETPKRKSGRHSLPASCTDCAGEPSFNYDKKVQKYKKNKRYTRAYSDEKAYDGVPNIHFLFQNQVFMPGDLFHKASYSEPKRTSQRQVPEVLKQRRIEFNSEPPLFFKNNALKYDANEFLNSKGTEEVDGINEKQDKNITDDKLCEVMSELNDLDQWADEQLHDNTISTSRTEDTKSDASTLGLIVASSCNLNMALDKYKCWSQGKWGVVPVQIKKIRGVTMEQVKKKLNMEINILRKCRHPNVILLMGLYPGVNDDVHIVCERFVDSLYGILYKQGRTLSAQTAVHYTLDIANALAFLKMHGYMHTDLHSTCIVVTAQDTAKLADLSPCMRGRKETRVENNYDDYSSEPVYVNIEDTQKPTTPESEPLISARSSESYLRDGVKKNHKAYSDSEFYRWQAPELYDPDEEGFVYPCSKSDVYSLCLVLWECCNAKIPWESHTYEKLKDAYTVWQVGLRLPTDGTYPGCLLDLLQKGLRVRRDQRIDLTILQSMLQSVKENLNKMEYIVIPLRTKKSDFSYQWDSTSPAESDCQSPKTIKHNAIVHPHSSTDSSPIYHTIQKADQVDKICFLSDEDLLPAKFDNLEKSYASNCSTPVSKFRKRNKVATPDLHRSDSTQYCSILSPHNVEVNDQSAAAEAATAKLSRSFTPKSYKPLQITVPDFNLDSIRDIVKNQNSERASYHFDIKNYSLPNTPIARSTKLRKNAWLSGELDSREKSPEKSQELSYGEKLKDLCKEITFEGHKQEDQKQETYRETEIKENTSNFSIVESPELKRPESPVEESVRDSYTGLKRIPDPPLDFSFAELDTRPSTWSTRSVQSSLYKVEEEVLANVNVKPLVAIHEKWIHEANKKNVRSFSLPEERRASVRAVKPASHCTDTMQKSLPQLYFKPSTYRPYRASPVSPAASWKSGPFEQYFQSRDSMTKSVNFPVRDNEHKRLDLNKSTSTDDVFEPNEKVDQATETENIEDYIRDLICSELQSLCDLDVSECSNKKTEEFLNQGVTNVVEGLKEDKPTIKSFSKVTVFGNNKPLIRITFNNNERKLQVLDKNVNVVVGENSKEKLDLSIDETSTDDHLNQLKRCQAFSAIQEACSTEDLYIDDDISTHLQENFGGKLKFIPLHGSLHELVCERDDDCCLFKVKQENGCDTIYFKCDNDTDVTDGSDRRDRVIFKRSISLVEERIQRVYPRAKRQNPVAALKKLSDKLKSRPKSEVLPTINKESRALSNSSPALYSGEREVEVNIENVMAYQDSSSDECLKCSAENDEFEIIEREIEDELSNTTSMVCKCLGKISEENLSTMEDNEDY